MNKDILEKYESMREEIDLIKEKEGFKCLRCGSCCYSSQPICELDLEYMKEKGVDINGIELVGSGLLSSRKIKSNDNGCYYFKNNSCKIHPYNSMLCYTYPFVANISDNKFFFKFCGGEDRERKNDDRIRQKLVTEDLKSKLDALFELNCEEWDKKFYLPTLKKNKN